MKKALIQNGAVKQVELVTFPVAAGLTWEDCPDNVLPGWLFAGGIFTAPPTPSQAEMDAQKVSRRDEELNRADMVAVIKWMREELNVIRAALPVPLPALTLTEIKTKIIGYYS